MNKDSGTLTASDQRFFFSNQTGAARNAEPVQQLFIPRVNASHVVLVLVAVPTLTVEGFTSKLGTGLATTKPHTVSYI